MGGGPALLRPAGGPGLTGAGPGPTPASRLRGGEARALNPRKVLLRADLAVDVTAFQPREQGCAARGCWNRREHGVQQRVTEQESYQLEAVQEKPFTFLEQVRLNVGQGEPGAAGRLPGCAPVRGEPPHRQQADFQGGGGTPAAGAGGRRRAECLPGEPPLSQIMGGPGAGRGGRVPHGGGADPAELPARRGGRPHRGGGAGPAGPGPGVEPPPGHPPSRTCTAPPSRPRWSGRSRSCGSWWSSLPAPRTCGSCWRQVPCPQRDGQLGVPGRDPKELGGDQLVLEGEARVTILYLDENDALQAPPGGL